MAENSDESIKDGNKRIITKKNSQQDSPNAKIWNEIVKNYEMIQGAQLSNSFNDT